MGSPPQTETMGEPHSSTAFRHCSTVICSEIVSLYSRIRPQPVHVRLHACKGSSIITRGNFSTPRIRLPAIYLLNFVVMLSGNLIHSSYRHCGAGTHPVRSAKLLIRRFRIADYGTAPRHKAEKHSGRDGTLNKTLEESRFR